MIANVRIFGKDIEKAKIMLSLRSIMWSFSFRFNFAQRFRLYFMNKTNLFRALEKLANSLLWNRFLDIFFGSFSVRENRSLFIYSNSVIWCKYKVYFCGYVERWCCTILILFLFDYSVHPFFVVLLDFIRMVFEYKSYCRKWQLSIHDIKWHPWMFHLSLFTTDLYRIYKSMDTGQYIHNICKKIIVET